MNIGIRSYIVTVIKGIVMNQLQDIESRTFSKEKLYSECVGLGSQKSVVYDPVSIVVGQYVTFDIGTISSNERKRVYLTHN